MANTPFFPAFRARLASLGRGVTRALPALRQGTLSQIETAVGRFVPAAAFQPAPSPSECPFSLHRTFWCFMWQMPNENTSCREVVRQVQALLALQGARQLDEGNSGYCQARARLPLALLEDTLADTAGAADRLIGPTGFLQGRTVKVCDCTTLVSVWLARPCLACPFSSRPAYLLLRAARSNRSAQASGPADDLPCMTPCAT
jgi:hypothetical protein